MSSLTFSDVSSGKDDQQQQQHNEQTRQFPPYFPTETSKARKKLGLWEVFVSGLPYIKDNRVYLSEYLIGISYDARALGGV
jgi:hypothetical protein